MNAATRDASYASARAREFIDQATGVVVRREIVQQHGGSLALQSAIGRGTTVSVSMPMQGIAARGSA